jgi:ankyrin repeat protein
MEAIMGGNRKIMFLKNLLCRLVLFFVFLSVMFLPACKDNETRKAEIERKGTVYSEEAFLHQVKTGNSKAVEMYIRGGINVNAKDRDGSTPLMIASERGDSEMARVLLENGADPNARDIDGYTALMFVSYSGNLEIARLLVKSGADVNARDKDGWTAMMFASIEKKTEVAEFLKKHGAGRPKT